MKKVYFILTIVALIGFTACENDDNSSIEEIEADMKKGEWVITYFYDTDSDETSNYTDYSFIFDDNEVLKAVASSGTTEGRWYITSDDDSSDDKHFYIEFLENGVLEELSDDWEILERNDKRIRLQDVSGGNGGTDYLTFEQK